MYIIIYVCIYIPYNNNINNITCLSWFYKQHFSDLPGGLISTSPAKFFTVGAAASATAAPLGLRCRPTVHIYIYRVTDNYL